MEMLLWMFLSAILALFICMRYSAVFTYWKIRGVSYVKPLQILKNDFDLFTGRVSIGSLFKKIYNYSEVPFEGFFVFNKPWLLIRNIELIKSVFITDFDYFCNRVTTNSIHDKLSSGIIFFVPNPNAKYLRNKLMPIFTSSKLKKFCSMIDNSGNKFASRIAQNIADRCVTNINVLSMEYSSNIMSLFAFGADIDSLENGHDIPESVKNIHKGTLIRNINVVCWMIAPYLAKLFRMKYIPSATADKLRNIFWQVYQQSEKNPEMGGNLMQHLIKLKSGSQNSDFIFDDDNLVAQGALCFVAGVDTISVTISYALYELSQNPNIQDRLRKEILDIFQDWNHLTYENLNESCYLDMVIKETLRKYTPFPYLDRLCVKDYKIPRTDITIPKGTNICVSLQGIHHDPSIYEKPLIFDPERFSKDTASSIPAGCYIPFSIGQRICIGDRLSLIVIKSALVKILSQFSIHPVNTSSVEYASNALIASPQKDIEIGFSKI